MYNLYFYKELSSLAQRAIRIDTSHLDKSTWAVIDDIIQCFEQLIFSLTIRYEELENLTYILKIANKNSYSNTNFRNYILNKIQDKMILDLYCNVDDSIVNLFFLKGQYHFDNGNFLDACKMFRRALMFCPDDENLQKGIDKCMSADNSVNNVVAKYKNPKLRYIKTVGNGILQSPKDIFYSQEDDLILVSDFELNKIFLFDFEDHLLNTLDIGLSRPFGMFNDRITGIWICDGSSFQLKHFKIDGTLINAVNIDKDSIGLRDFTQAMRGAIFNNKIVVVMSDKHFSMRSLIVVEDNKTHQFSYYCEDSLGVNNANDIHVVNNTLYVNDYCTGKIYYLNNKNRFLPLSSYNLPGQAYTFTSIGKDFYQICVSGNGLSIITNKGNLVSLRNQMSDFIGSKTHLSAVRHCKREQKEFLLMADQINKCIHIFEV